MTDEEIRSLYRTLLQSWNDRNAAKFAGLFNTDGSIVGFDGTPVDGCGAIEAHLEQIFADHPTAAYVSIIREIRFLTPDVAMLRSVVGMVPPGKSDLNPAVNAIQSLIATRQGDQWKISLLQNTPAQFHGRPEAAEALTRELRHQI